MLLMKAILAIVALTSYCGVLVYNEIHLNFFFSIFNKRKYLLGINAITVRCYSFE